MGVLEITSSFFIIMRKIKSIILTAFTVLMFCSCATNKTPSSNTVETAQRKKGGYPVITDVTDGTIKHQGDNVIFDVTATIEPLPPIPVPSPSLPLPPLPPLPSTTLHYQWYDTNGIAINNAIYPSYVIRKIRSTNEGTYNVKVSNGYGSAIRPLTLTVLSTNILPQCLSGISSNIASFAWNYDFVNNPTVSGFKLYYGIASKTYTNNVGINGKITTGSISNLLSGTTYYFAVTAGDTNGLESDYSNEVFVNTSTTNVQFDLNIQMLTTGIPRVQTQVCPFQSLTFLYKTNLMSPNWMTLTNLIADKYGNAIYDDAGAKGQPQRFYKATTP
jgi:hypothetical protein